MEARKKTPDEILADKQAAMPDKELIFLAQQEISELAKSYGKSHHMSIPPQIKDTDMILSELIRRYKKELDQLWDLKENTNPPENPGQGLLAEIEALEKKPTFDSIKEDPLTKLHSLVTKAWRDYFKENLEQTAPPPPRDAGLLHLSHDYSKDYQISKKDISNQPHVTPTAPPTTTIAPPRDTIAPPRTKSKGVSKLQFQELLEAQSITMPHCAKNIIKKEYNESIMKNGIPFCINRIDHLSLENACYNCEKYWLNPLKAKKNLAYLNQPFKYPSS